MTMLELFLVFLEVGFFSVGGGLAAMPLIQRQVVEIKGWLTLTEFTDLVTIAEMTPGPFAINAATFVGTRLFGVGGSIVATLAYILPSVIIVCILAMLYLKYKELSLVKGVLAGLRPAIVGLIASAACGLVVVAFWQGGLLPHGIKSVNFIAIALFAAALFVLRKWKKVSPILVMLGCGAVGGVIYSLI